MWKYLMKAYILAFIVVIAIPILIEVVYNWLKKRRDNSYARKWLADNPDADLIDFFKHIRIKL